MRSRGARCGLRAVFLSFKKILCLARRLSLSSVPAGLRGKVTERRDGVGRGPGRVQGSGPAVLPSERGPGLAARAAVRAPRGPRSEQPAAARFGAFVCRRVVLAAEQTDVERFTTHQGPAGRLCPAWKQRWGRPGAWVLLGTRTDNSQIRNLPP